jgi:hypothetical protein
MDLDVVKQAAEHHAKSMASGDMAAAAEDLTEEARAAIGPLVRQLPRPIKEAEVVSTNSASDGFVVQIVYRGDDKSTTIESVWKEVDGRPRIVEAKIP